MKKNPDDKESNVSTIAHLNDQFQDANPAEVLEYFYRQYQDKLVFSSSMGAEDQVITDMIFRTGKPIRILTLDTGRLFPETYDLIDRTHRQYGIGIEVFFPDRENIENMVKNKGVNLFYESIENRKLCCQYRKKEPLKRALSGMNAWITGIRKDQTLSRFNARLVEWDEIYSLIKINLLYKWTEEKVWEYIRKYDVPYNKLHDMGFPSIGCQPCTRAVKPGDDPRSGRWWWEDQGHRECGLHVKGG